MTITDHDIRDQVVIPALAEEVEDYDVAAIIDELLTAYPRAEWEWDEARLSYEHPDLDVDDFWAIVEHHPRKNRTSTELAATYRAAATKYVQAQAKLVGLYNDVAGGRTSYVEVDDFRHYEYLAATEEALSAAMDLLASFGHGLPTVALPPRHPEAP